MVRNTKNLDHTTYRFVRVVVLTTPYVEFVWGGGWLV